MTWFTEFSQVIHDAAHLGQLGHLEAAEAALHSGDPTRLLEAFPGGVRIDDPRFGRVEGEAALKNSAKNSCRTSVPQRWNCGPAGSRKQPSGSKVAVMRSASPAASAA